MFHLFHKINYKIFQLHYSPLKEPKLQKNSKQIKENEMQKRGQKVKLGNGLSLYLYYKVFQRNVSTLTTNLVSIFSALKFLIFFFSEHFPSSLDASIMELNNSLLNAFIAPLSLSLNFP